jgi:hypothetical protein
VQSTESNFESLVCTEATRQQQATSKKKQETSNKTQDTRNKEQAKQNEQAITNKTITNKQQWAGHEAPRR